MQSAGRCVGRRHASARSLASGELRLSCRPRVGAGRSGQAGSSPEGSLPALPVPAMLLICPGRWGVQRAGLTPVRRASPCAPCPPSWSTWPWGALESAGLVAWVLGFPASPGSECPPGLLAPWTGRGWLAGWKRASVACAGRGGIAGLVGKCGGGMASSLWPSAGLRLFPILVGTGSHPEQQAGSRGASGHLALSPRGHPSHL